MRVISKKPLQAFAEKHPAADPKVFVWHRLMKASSAANLTELRETFNTADYVPENFTVFNVGGNAYRIVAVVIYDIQVVYIKHVFTHAEYDKWSKDNRKK